MLMSCLVSSTKWPRNLVRMAVCVNFLYHSAPDSPCRTLPGEPAMSRPGRPASPSRADLEAYWMPFTANRQFKAKPRLLAQGLGHALLDAGRPPDSRRRRGPVVRERRPRPPRDHRSGRAASSRRWTSRRRSRWAIRRRLRAGERGGEDRARRARSRVLHELGLRVGRHGAEDRARLSPRARRRARAPGSSAASAAITA